MWGKVCRPTRRYRFLRKTTRGLLEPNGEMAQGFDEYSSAPQFQGLTDWLVLNPCANLSERGRRVALWRTVARWRGCPFHYRPTNFAGRRYVSPHRPERVGLLYSRLATP